jgi:hypothetical protein
MREILASLGHSNREELIKRLRGEDQTR